VAVIGLRLSREFDVTPPYEPNDDELAQLLRDAREGDRSALVRLAECYGPDLLRVARRSLPRRLRTVFDSQDFVQAMWATFLRHDVELDRFRTHDELYAYLSGIVSHKVSDQIKRRLKSQKATMHREVSLAAWGDGAAVASPRAHTPSQAVIAQERMESLLRDQPDHYRLVLTMKAAGASVAEIASELGMNEGHIRRIINKASERMAET
jgi:RNA polymerase sigma factor (sigma-70 family)